MGVSDTGATDLVLQQLRARVAELEEHAAHCAGQESRYAKLDFEHAQLEALLQHLTIAVMIAEAPSGRVRYANQQFERVFGTPPVAAQGIDEYPGDQAFYANGSAYPARDWPLARSLLTGEVVHGEEATLRRADGRFGIVAITSAPILDAAGRVVGAMAAIEDVTARKHAEAALHESAAVLRAVNEGTSELIYVKDLQGRFVMANPAVLRLLRRQAGDVIGKTVAEFYADPSISERILATDRRIMEYGKPETLEEVVEASEGLRTYLSTKSPYLDPQGNVIGLIGISTDITERKRAENALRESEEHFRSLANSIPQLAWMAHPDGHLFWYNQQWYDYAGLAPGQAESWTWQSAADPDQLPGVLERWNRAVAGGEPWEDVFRLRRHDGQMRWHLSRAVPVREQQGRIVRWFGTCTDISERWEAEQRLSESEARFRLLFDANIIGIFTADLEKIIEANDVFLGMIGYTRDDLTAGRILWTSLEPSGHSQQGERLREGLRSTGTCPPIESEYCQKGGTRVSVLIGATTLQRSPLRFLCCSLDLTERKALEKKLIDRQKLESIGLLAGGIAHDFNNLLVGVMGNAALAKDMISSGSPAAACLDGVVQAAERAAHLTRQMLAYSGRGQFVIQTIDLSETVLEIAKLVQPSTSRKISVDLDLSAEALLVEGDPGQIQQIVMNLLINAAEAIGDAPGKVTVHTGRRILSKEGVQELDGAGTEIIAGDYVYLDVTDTGCGMDAATRARIFDPFFTTKFTGRGLGLAAVSGIVRSHHGAIQVASAPGEGSTFQVFLPAFQGEESAAGADQPPKEDLCGVGTILVVDDEEMVLRIAGLSLERHGYRALLASSGEKAIATLAEEGGRVSLVLLDLSMPGLSGQDTLAAIRRTSPGLPVLVSSGYGEIEIRRQFGGHKISGFVRKPYTGAQLLAKVKTALTAA